MITELQFLDEVRQNYFTDEDEIRKNVPLTIEDVSELKDRLFKVGLNGFNSIIFEVLDSYIDELAQESILRLNGLMYVGLNSRCNCTTLNKMMYD